MNFENLKNNRRKMIQNLEDVLTGAVLKPSRKNQITINLVKHIQDIGTSETQFQTLSSLCGLLTGHVVERIG